MAAPRHPGWLVAFDAEELGLRGAEALVGSSLLPASAIALNVNLDMVSRNDANEIFAAGTYQTPSLRPILEDVQRRSAVKILFGHDRPMVKAGGVEDWTTQSDHGVFHDAGMPFLYFGVDDHADYHQPTDTADKVEPAVFRRRRRHDRRGGGDARPLAPVDSHEGHVGTRRHEAPGGTHRNLRNP